MLIAADALWSGGRLAGPALLETADGTVTALRRTGTADLIVRVLLPGLTDLQVNGGGGTMLNDDPTPDGLRTIAAAHRRLGTAAILPTVITDRPEVTEAAADAVLATRGEPGLLGLHIEGPHIAAARRGTHDPAHIRPLDLRTVAMVETLRAAGVPVMITLAPEIADAALLARLVASGAIVSAGHSEATASQTERALVRGVSCFTHLFNAMPPMTSRAPGIAAAAIDSTAYVGVIADGIHVDWRMLRLALRARPARGRSFAVSDAMATVGGPDRFTLYGRTIRVAAGALRNAEGALAGAHIDLRKSLRNLVHHVGLPLSEAIAMCADTPRAILGLPPQSIAPGTALSDLLALDGDMNRVPLP